MSVRFQWVKCQLDALGKCLSVSDLRKALRSLPRDLDDTYTRILQDIDNKGYGDQVAKIMQWLACSVAPMSLVEIAEVFTVDMESDTLIDFERRLEDPQDILALCSSLVLLIGKGTGRRTEILQFAHFSVREFLESPRLDNGPARRFAIDKMQANILIAESCIAYNIQIGSIPDPVSMNSIRIYAKYPLLIYAAENWNIHASNARENGRIISLCERLFRSRSTTSEPLSWLGFMNRTRYLNDVTGRLSPLHCAIFFSLPRITRKLILEGGHVNSKGGESGKTPLILVTLGGGRRITDIHERVEDVQFLLNHGAEVNACDDEGCTALMYASRRGSIQLVQILLDNGAHLEAQDEKGKTALAFACCSRSTELVHWLLGKGASIDSPIGEKALGYASAKGFSESVQILLDRRVNVNATCDFGFPYEAASNAVIRALVGRHYEIADLLAKNGGDVNARYSLLDRDAVLLEQIFANPGHLSGDLVVFYMGKDKFEDASSKHRDKMLRFLIEHGADPKLVRTDHLNDEQKERYREWLAKSNITPSPE